MPASKTRELKTELRSELCRKAIHILIALVPALAALNFHNTALLLMAGVLVYASTEIMRFLGFSLPIISTFTAAVSRKREKDGFAIGPVTLGLGAFLTLVLFPPQVAAAAIYTLAFGDSAACLAGKYLGRIRPVFLAGKSIEGSLACFLVSALVTWLVFHDWKTAAAVGFAAALIDALPFKDFDNLLMPLAAGAAAIIILNC